MKLKCTTCDQLKDIEVREHEGVLYVTCPECLESVKKRLSFLRRLRYDLEGPRQSHQVSEV